VGISSEKCLNPDKCLRGSHNFNITGALNFSGAAVFLL